MDEKGLEMLEFHKIREILAGFTSFSVSRKLALNLQPSPDPDLVSLSLQRSSEARRLLSCEPNFAIGEIQDIREAVGMAARGKFLDPEILLLVRTILSAARNTRSVLGKLSSECPSLWQIAKQITALPEVENEIGKCIDETGQVLDYASLELAELRGNIRVTRQRLQDRLESFLKSQKGQRVIQEPFITERENRYVIPVKSELQNEIEGIVHDVSNTGATVFMEPWVTVGLGNELRQLEMEEKHEVDRILARLSNRVGANEEALSGGLESLAQLDLELAKARYAERAKATEPVVTARGDQSPAILKLVSARHPLLRDKPVPLTVEIGQDFSSLVITGPNAGGKTVAIKTIGLLTLMAQAGMPIPASAESTIPVFDNVFADIGDEQSIEETISSFSWHINNIIRITQSATENSLVLLDELGTSTDPDEGAALARAILLYFLSKGMLIVATTHYSELKIFAHSTTGLQNASLDFDPVTLTPTYHLTVGIPGGSNALSTASRLGLSPNIINNAQKMLGKGTQEMETLLADLNAEKQKAESLRVDLERERREAENLREGRERELESLSQQKSKMLQETRDTITREAAELQKRIRQASSELKKAKSRESIDQARKTAETIREQLRTENWQTTAGGETGEQRAEEEIAVGDEVELVNTHTRGTVMSLSEKMNEVEVQAGQIKVKVDLSELRKVKTDAGKVPIGAGLVKNVLRGKKVLPELDLRGKRADEVEQELDRYLNDASLAGLGEVSIIHGFGTGKVRQVVRGVLGSHPLVKSFHSGDQQEGGEGVTIVEL